MAEDETFSALKGYKDKNKLFATIPAGPRINSSDTTPLCGVFLTCRRDL
jgi:hypothetical protein